MRTTGITLFVLLCVFDAKVVYSQESGIAPANISEVSAILELAPGLYILDAYEWTSENEYDFILLDDKTGARMGATWRYEYPSRIINPQVMLCSERVGEPQEHVVFFYHISKGMKSIVRSPTYEFDNYHVYHLHHLGIGDGILLLYLGYDRYHEPYPTDVTAHVRKYMIVRITGDWEAFGFDIPTETAPSSDLNADGIVDFHDLLILQRDWYKQTR